MNTYPSGREPDGNHGKVSLPASVRRIHQVDRRREDLVRLKVVNDDKDNPGEPTDEFQPSIAAGPGGAMAVAFYDRRAKCPSDPSALPQDVGRTNFCIDTSLQAYKDTGSGAVPVGGQLSHLPIHVGSNEPGPEGRRIRPDGVCWP